MALKPVEHPAPEWYQTGKELRDHDSKDPRFRKGFGESSTGGSARQAYKMNWLSDFFQETVTAGNTSDPLYIPDTAKKVTFTIEPGVGGSAYVEYSIDNVHTIHNETNNGISNGWDTWSTGSVNAITLTEVSAGFTAVRLVATTADATWSVRITD